MFLVKNERLQLQVVNDIFRTCLSEQKKYSTDLPEEFLYKEKTITD